MLAAILVLLLLARGDVGAQAATEPIPVSPHHAELLRHEDTPTLPALIGDGGMPSVRLARAARPAQQQKVVFGFLPYWIDHVYYEQIDFDLLTHIAAFSVEVNGDGTLGDDHGWPWTGLIDAAHRHGVRVILTATLFGDSDVKRLIGSQENRQRFYGRIRDKILEGSADGVNIDFEGPGSNGWPSMAADFLAELTTYLHAEIPGCEVSFASPAVDWSARWDFAEIAASCDYLFVMGYAFSGSWSGMSGPTSPLKGGSRNITTTITDRRDYGDVTRDHPEKLILGVPYYGCRWTTLGNQPGSSIKDFGGYPQLSVTLQTAPAYGRLWDSTTQTSWYRYQLAGEWIQVWFDDAGSLAQKYDLALEKDLRGIGMWALGYEGNRPEPWQLVEEKIGRRASTAVVEDRERPEDNTHAGNDVGPQAVQVGDGYPNPFNASTIIAYHLARPGQLHAQLYDALGRHVKSWRRSHEAGGSYAWQWDGFDERGDDVASGVYLLRMRFSTDDGESESVVEVRTRRMALVR